VVHPFLNGSTARISCSSDFGGVERDTRDEEELTGIEEVLTISKSCDRRELYL
jgi:hypothetical protein